MRNLLFISIVSLVTPTLSSAQEDTRPLSIPVVCTLADEKLKCPACNVRQNELEIRRGESVKVFEYQGVAYTATFGELTPSLGMDATEVKTKKVLVDVFSFFNKISTDPDVMPPQFRARVKKDISFFCAINPKR